MDNLSIVLKRKRDAEDRMRRSDPAKNIIVGEDGAGGNTSSNPAAALTVAVESINNLTGDVTLAAGTNITLTPSGNEITIDAAGGGGAFTDLSDAPAAYTGAGGKIVAVKADVSGLEFVPAPDAANGLPAGGTAGQLLAKIDGTDFNAEWVDPPSSASSDTQWIYGSGNRTFLISATASGGSSGQLSATLGTGQTNSFYLSGGTAEKTLKFEFYKPVKINGIAFIQSGQDANGIWTLSGSNDDTTWSNIITDFVLGGTPYGPYFTALYGTYCREFTNSAQYTYYKLTLNSGSSTSNSPYIQLILFKSEPL